MSCVIWTPLITMREITREAYRQAITHHEGNLKAAAEDLVIPYSTFCKKIYTVFTREELKEFKPNADDYFIMRKVKEQRRQQYE